MKDNTLTTINSKNLNFKNNRLEFLKNLDIFGINFDFRIDNQEKFQTTSGGLWLIGFTLLSIALYLNTIIDYFKNPLFNTYFYEKSLDFTSTIDNINLSKEKFDFGINLIYNTEHFTNETFLVKGFHFMLDKSSNYFEKHIELNHKKCNPDNFISNYNDSHPKIKKRLNDMICFDHSNYSIGGSEFGENYSYISSNIIISEKVSLKKVLALIEEHPPEFQIIYPDIFVDFNDYSKFQFQPNYLYNGFESGLKKTIDFMVIRYVYEQDLSILYQNKQNFTYTKYETSSYRNRLITPSMKRDITLASVNIRAINYFKNNQKYIWKFITILQLQLTNLLNYLIAFKFFASIINFRIAKNYLTDKIFYIDESSVINLKKNLEKSKINENKQNSENNEENYQSLNKDRKIEIKKNEKNTLKEMENLSRENLPISKTLINNSNLENSKRNFIDKNDVDYSKIEKDKTEVIDKSNINFSILNVLDNQKVENLKIENENKKFKDGYTQEDKFKVFDKILDIAYFVKKMEEIDLLKFLLFDEDNIYMFNYLTGKIKLFDEKHDFYNLSQIEIQQSTINGYNQAKKNLKLENSVGRKIHGLFEDFILNH